MVSHADNLLQPHDKWMRKALEQARIATADDPAIVADLAYCYATAGREDEARELLQELEQRAKTIYVSPMGFALIHAGLGERDKVFEYLAEAYEIRAFLLPLIVVDSSFEPLRSDPRFQDLVRRLGLPQPTVTVASG